MKWAPRHPEALTMSQTNLIALAEACSAVRGAIGKMLLAAADSPEHAKASESYQRSLRTLLRVAREEECGVYLEVAGEIATRD